MGIRIGISKILVKLGQFIQGMAIVVLRPKDMVQIGRNTYGKKDNVEAWGNPNIVDAGFFDNEKEILENFPSKTGKLLLLGSGGGRDAIALSKAGYAVTTIDFIPEMAKKTLENARRHNVMIETRVQEISELHLDTEPFDIIWFSASMYSSVPTRKRRIATLSTLRKSLRSSGFLVCLFHWVPDKKNMTFNFYFKKFFAFLTCGYYELEKGDMLWENIEFIHSFSSENELKTEFEKAGYAVVKYIFHEKINRGGAILKKVSNAIPQVSKKQESPKKT